MYDLLSDTIHHCAKNFPSVHPVHVMYTIEHFTFGMGILDASFRLLPGHCTHNILLELWDNARIMFKGRYRAKRTREHIIVHRNAEKLNEQLVLNNINESNENRSYIKM